VSISLFQAISHVIIIHYYQLQHQNSRTHMCMQQRVVNSDWVLSQHWTLGSKATTLRAQPSSRQISNFNPVSKIQIWNEVWMISHVKMELVSNVSEAACCVYSKSMCNKQLHHLLTLVNGHRGSLQNTGFYPDLHMADRPKWLHCIQSPWKLQII
jgi:hypothetical protein